MEGLGPLKTQVMTMFMMKKNDKNDDIYTSFSKSIPLVKTTKNKKIFFHFNKDKENFDSKFQKT